MLREWIDQHAASRGDAPYLEDAAGSGVLTYAGLARSVRAWCRLLDEAGARDIELTGATEGATIDLGASA